MRRGPVIVIADDAPLFFRSVEEAERYMEPVDVRSGAYVVYDSTGQRLRLDVVTRRRPFLLGTADVEMTQIAAGDDPPAQNDVAELCRSLADLLRTQGDDATPIDGMDALIARCVERFGYTE